MNVVFKFMICLLLLCGIPLHAQSRDACSYVQEELNIIQHLFDKMGVKFKKAFISGQDHSLFVACLKDYLLKLGWEVKHCIEKDEQIDLMIAKVDNQDQHEALNLIDKISPRMAILQYEYFDENYLSNYPIASITESHAFFVRDDELANLTEQARGAL